MADLFFEDTVPEAIQEERALEFVWRCASDEVRDLVSQLASRHLFKRVFELRMSDIGGQVDYTAMATGMADTRVFD